MEMKKVPLRKVQEKQTEKVKQKEKTQTKRQQKEQEVTKEHVPQKQEVKLDITETKLKRIPEKPQETGTVGKDIGTTQVVEVPMHPVQVVVALPKHQFNLDEEALTRVLMHHEVKDKHVVVVSIAGAFRKGKSFLLDFLLRYLKRNYTSVNLGMTEGDWLGPDDVPLEGFRWREGSDRETTGIVIWSEAFIAHLPSEEKVAVVLMDTQGAFDQDSTMKDCATVLALSMMVSSVQIYNLSQNIQEDDLMNLQLFTEYGKLALEDSGKTPFQKLMFLVRDWSYPYEAKYGEQGGSELLAKRLRIKADQDPQHQIIRKHIQECFTDINCFLLPHPGFTVASSPEFDGRLKDMESNFIENLKVLIPLLLAPENLIVKEIVGQRLKAKELVQYFKSYMKIYNSNELPEPKMLLVATAEANNLSAVAASKETYHQLMEAVCGGIKPYLNTAHLECEHLRIKDKAMELFSKKPKMGGEEFSKQYKEKLHDDLDEQFSTFKARNDSKDIFKVARTPTVFFLITVVCYVLAGLLSLFCLYTLSNTCKMIMSISLLTLVLWSYIKYSGKMKETGDQIDELSNHIWDNFMKPIYQVFVEKSLGYITSETSNFATQNGKIKLS